MTVTDEDIDLFLSVNNIWPDSETAAHVRKNRAFSWEVEQIAKYRQAAYAAGLERAAVIADKYEALPLMQADAWSEEEADWHETGCIDSARAIATAIRAEKDKT